MESTYAVGSGFLYPVAARKKKDLAVFCPESADLFPEGDIQWIFFSIVFIIKPCQALKLSQVANIGVKTVDKGISRHYLKTLNSPVVIVWPDKRIENIPCYNSFQKARLLKLPKRRGSVN
jgi:hypothetical protein